jgi:glycosyltransferase involved in cell wall biosynthesis
MNRWHRAKGYHLAIDLARRTGIELVLAGEHPDREMFEHQRLCALEAVEMAKDLPNVSFVWLPPDPDHHTTKRRLYRRAKALLYTVQFQEPFGLSQAEALACGTPVVGTNFGSVPEVVEDGVTGRVVSNDLDGLTGGVADVLQISNELCRSRAIERFDRRVMARNYLAEYQRVLRGETWG